MQVTLDILVEALGRVNFGCVWDYKGLTSPDVKLNGEHHAQLTHGLTSVMILSGHANVGQLQCTTQHLIVFVAP